MATYRPTHASKKRASSPKMDYDELAGRYAQLRKENQALLDAMNKLQSQLKFYRQREAAMYSWFEGEKFEVAVNGKKTYFRRVDEAGYLRDDDGRSADDARRGAFDQVQSEVLYQQQQQDDDDTTEPKATQEEPASTQSYYDSGFPSSPTILGKGMTMNVASSPNNGRAPIELKASVSPVSVSSGSEEPPSTPRVRHRLERHEDVSPTQRLSKHKDTKKQPSTVQKTTTSSKKRKSDSDWHSSTKAIPDLAEDGEIESEPRKSPRVAEEEPRGTRCLEDLLGGVKAPSFQLKPTELMRPPAKPRRVPPPSYGDTMGSTKKPRAETLVTTTPENQSKAQRSDAKSSSGSKRGQRRVTATPPEPLREITANVPRSTTRAKRSFEREAPSDEWTGVALRDRPIESLGIEHFKVNADSNQGLDYAFSEVVRNKAQRQCLELCMRPDCCGKYFMSMARIKGIPDEGVCFEELDEEDRIALDDVDADGRTVLSFDYMSGPAKKQVLLDARARQFARRFARHRRYNYDRPASPPGFWETDFPSTLQVEQNKGAADEAERKRVEQMYEEAMRPYGKWKFVDE